jgi:hypothetical protein
VRRGAAGGSAPTAPEWNAEQLGARALGVVLFDDWRGAASEWAALPCSNALAAQACCAISDAHEQRKWSSWFHASTFDDAFACGGFEQATPDIFEWIERSAPWGWAV